MRLLLRRIIKWHGRVAVPYGYERTFTVGADGTFASAASGGYSEQKGVAAVEI